MRKYTPHSNCQSKANRTSKQQQHRDLKDVQTRAVETGMILMFHFSHRSIKTGIKSPFLKGIE